MLPTAGCLFSMIPTLVVKSIGDLSCSMSHRKKSFTRLLLSTPPHNICSTNLKFLTAVDHLLTERRQLLHQSAFITNCRPLLLQAVHLLLLCHNFLWEMVRKGVLKGKENQSHRLHHACKSWKAGFSPESKVEISTH